MNPDQLRAIIRQTLVELLAPAPRRALVVFTGGLLGFDECLGGLRALADEGVALDVVQTPSARRILDQHKIGALGLPQVDDHLVANHQMLIAPTLTVNVAAKVSHGIADCLASNLFSEFIMSNRLVVASSTAVSPDEAPKRSIYPEMPSGYAELLRANLTALTSFGVRLARSQALARTALAAFDRRDAAHKDALIAQGIPAQALAACAAPAIPAPAPRPHGGGVSHRGTRVTDTRREPAPRGPVTGAPSTLKLISQGVVQKLDPGSCLAIRPDTKVTAAARDMAASRNIQITVVV